MTLRDLLLASGYSPTQIDDLIQQWVDGINVLAQVAGSSLQVAVEAAVALCAEVDRERLHRESTACFAPDPVTFL